ncbi:hypothetical protein PUN28_005501 [Cardiocondyla obscurior]|uniref:Uncharacterized protein n=1 Tax=Cardiocondyla obscurior TaxID=286306 RepID=A0AAW2GJ43_9HYME
MATTVNFETLTLIMPARQERVRSTTAVPAPRATPSRAFSSPIQKKRWRKRGTPEKKKEIKKREKKKKELLYETHFARRRYFINDNSILILYQERLASSHRSPSK